MARADGFANLFWTSDYAGGLGALFSKLSQGAAENQQILTLAKLRADAETNYSRKLMDILPIVDRMSSSGFAKDDGASVRRAYDCMRAETEAAAKGHRNIAANINELVVLPFSQWCADHETRLQNSQDDLQNKLEAHDRQAEHVQKLRTTYFNKCRQLEDLEEEGKLAFQDPENSGAQASPSAEAREGVEDKSCTSMNQFPDVEPLDIGGKFYDAEGLAELLADLLRQTPMGQVKVPILGTYQNTSSGSEIASVIQKQQNDQSLSYAEHFGQDLIGHGILRLVGSVGNSFVNSSRLSYQWRPKAFRLARISENLNHATKKISPYSIDYRDVAFAGQVSEILSSSLAVPWRPLMSQQENEPLARRLQRESAEADQVYSGSVRLLDKFRTQLEEAMVDHFKFMERCELDRLKAIKAVILDFSGTISNAIPSLQSTVDHMMLFHETISPAGDLRYFLENYQTGPFAPKVVVYENYYNDIKDQIFGVDLEARAKADHKRIPSIITTLLTFLDRKYPDLEGDEARQGVWLVDVPLAATHHLRRAINESEHLSLDMLERYETPIVASTLRLYLLELPDSLVSAQTYEIIRAMYSTSESLASTNTRISIIQNTLGQLRLSNIASLDALITHFTRFLELTSASENYVVELASSLGPCILRSRLDNRVYLQEKCASRLIRDLFDQKEAIFGALKKASLHPKLSQNVQDMSTQARRRSVSTDESQRKANIEERNRAIVSRSRNNSPAPTIGQHRTHRREKSCDPSARFPIASSPSYTDRRKTTNRASLDVPSQNDER